MKIKPVSLTYFIDFVFTTGSKRKTVVKNAMNPKPYNPAQDHWKQLREGIISFHEKGNGSAEKSQLDEYYRKATVKHNKKDHYTQCIENYKKWLGRKSVEWFDPYSRAIGEGSVRINVNPELGLIENDNPILIKLFFKELEKKVRKEQAGVILALMEHALREKLAEQYPNFKHVRLGLLDVRNGSRLFESGSISVAEFRPIVLSELKGFTGMWEAMVE